MNRSLALRTRTPIALAAFASLVAAGCSAGHPAPAAPNRAPATESVAPASPAPADADRAEEAPASGAPAPPPAGASAPSSTKAESERAGPSDMDVWGRQLENALTLSAPDCSTAWALRDRICDLAQRLCDIAGRSAEPEVAERCSDGRARCERATTRVRAGCAE